MKSTRKKAPRQPAVILGFDGGEPVLPISKLTRRQWAVICPFCGGEHWHGRGGLDGSTYGGRASHCFSGEYSAAMPTTALLEEAAKVRPGRA